MTVTSEYSEKFGISNSSLKDWGKLSPLQWKKKWIDGEKDKSDESHFVFGSLLDILLFTPETFNKKYYIYNGLFPSDAIVYIVKDIFNKIKTTNEEILKNNKECPIEEPTLEVSLDVNDDLILESIKNYPNYDSESGEMKFGWQNNWKDETRVTKVKEQGKAFFTLLSESKGKEIISSSLLSLCEELKTILITNDITRDYFIPSEGIELYHQFEIYDIFIPKNGFAVPRKGCLDILIVNHNEKTIRVVDFKTDQNAFNFIYTAKKFDYCGQLTYYSDLIRNLIADPLHAWYEYKILPPRNIVIDKFEKMPYVYEYSSYDMDIAVNGNRYFLPKIPGTNDPIGRIVKGWEEKLSEISVHFSENNWQQPIDVIKNKYQTLYLYEN